MLGLVNLIAQAVPDNSGTPSLVVILSALAGIGTGAGALYVSWRNSRSSATKDYVATNLDSMRQLDQMRAAEMDRLTRRNADQEVHIERLQAEVDRLEGDLELCQRSCAESSRRIETLERDLAAEQERHSNGSP